jgi:hypothetical protein
MLLPDVFPQGAVDAGLISLALLLMRLEPVDQASV